MKHLLISACLLGLSCRYDGQRRPLPALAALMEQFVLVPVCPEQLGGLKTPRLPAERLGNRVVNTVGEDLTAEYARGAREVLRMAKLFDCTTAILKARSPSCGPTEVYDGTFTHTVVQRPGTTAELLIENGLTVIDETQIAQLLD